MTPQPNCPVTWWRQKPVIVVAKIYACDWAIMAYNRINNKFEGVSSFLIIMYRSRDMFSKFLPALIWDIRQHSSTVWWEITAWQSCIWRVSKEWDKGAPLGLISAVLSGSPFRGRSAGSFPEQRLVSTFIICTNDVKICVRARLAMSVHHSQFAVSWVVVSDELDLPFQNGWVRPCLKYMNLKKGKKQRRR